MRWVNKTPTDTSQISCKFHQLLVYSDSRHPAKAFWATSIPRLSLARPRIVFSNSSSNPRGPFEPASLKCSLTWSPLNHMTNLAFQKATSRLNMTVRKTKSCHHSLTRSTMLRLVLRIWEREAQKPVILTRLTGMPKA